MLLDTADDDGGAVEGGDTFAPGDVIRVINRSVLVLSRALPRENGVALSAAATAGENIPSSARATSPDAPLPRPATRGSTLPSPKPARRTGGVTTSSTTPG